LGEADFEIRSMVFVGPDMASVIGDLGKDKKLEILKWKRQDKKKCERLGGGNR